MNQNHIPVKEAEVQQKKQIRFAIILCSIVVVLIVATIIGTTITSRNFNELAQPEFDRVDFGGISWFVLDEQDSKKLLISEYVLFPERYHEHFEHVTWATSTLRTYLNEDFYNRLNANDRTQILSVTNHTPDNPWFNTDGGEDTQDKIFLLSIEEMLQYFGDSGRIDNHRFGLRVINDEYNAMRHAGYADGVTFARPPLSWLRSPGRFQGHAAFIDKDSGNRGTINLYGEDTNYYGGVRPALWLITE